MIDRFNIPIQHIPKAIMFQTIAVSVSIVCVLLCGVGYMLYKKGIQMLKNIDEKYEEGKLNLQVKVSEFEDKVKELKISHREMVESLNSRINVLENIVDHNLEHTENLIIDLNNKNMVTRNMLYEVKKQFSISTREHTSQFTDTKNEIDIIKTTFNDMKKVIVTQQELEEAVFECGTFKGNTETQRYMYANNQMYTWIKCLNSECKSNSAQIGHLCNINNHKNGYFGGGHMHQRVMRLNKKYYLYSSSMVSEDKGKILPGSQGILFDMPLKYDETTGRYGVYECGRMNVITKEVSWH